MSDDVEQYRDDISFGARNEVLMNTGDGRFVEVQGTAEEVPFSIAEMDAMRDKALTGCAELSRLQQGALTD